MMGRLLAFSLILLLVMTCADWQVTGHYSVRTTEFTLRPAELRKSSQPNSERIGICESQSLVEVLSAWDLTKANESRHMIQIRCDNLLGFAEANEPYPFTVWAGDPPRIPDNWSALRSYYLFGNAVGGTRKAYYPVDEKFPEEPNISWATVHQLLQIYSLYTDSLPPRIVVECIGQGRKNSFTLVSFSNDRSQLQGEEGLVTLERNESEISFHGGAPPCGKSRNFRLLSAAECKAMSVLKGSPSCYQP